MGEMFQAAMIAITAHIDEYSIQRGKITLSACEAISEVRNLISNYY